MPAGAPFAYGPLALLWYLPALGDPGRLELLLTMGLLAVFAVRGRPLGLALFATLPALLVTSTDGSNDTSAGVLLLVALLAAQRRPVLGGALLALAAAFKPYAVAWLLPLLAYGGIPLPLLAFVVVSLIAWGWAVIAWGAAPILDSLRRADGLHAQAYYSLAWVLKDLNLMPEQGWAITRYIAGAADGDPRLDVGPDRPLVRDGGHRRVPGDVVHRLVVHLRVPGRDRSRGLLAPR